MIETSTKKFGKILIIKITRVLGFVRQYCEAFNTNPI